MKYDENPNFEPSDHEISKRTGYVKLKQLNFFSGSYYLRC